MTSKITTEDCKLAINAWFISFHKQSPGEFKRIKKFKNQHGENVRIFEHKKSNTVVNVIEKIDFLEISYAKDLVGKDYFFAFCSDETYSDNEDVICFSVVEKKYFIQNGQLDSVHFLDTHKLPIYFEEVQESIFNVWETTKEKTRRELITLGFTESKELTILLNEDNSDFDTSYYDELAQKAYGKETDNEAEEELAELARKDPINIAKQFFFKVTDENGMFCAIITPVVYWYENGCWYDQGMLPVDVLLNGVGFELTESVYEFSEELETKDDINNYLTKKGFIYNQSL